MKKPLLIRMFIALSICLLITLVLLYSLLPTQKSDMDKLVGLWKEIYGNIAIIELPEKTLYATIHPEKDALWGRISVQPLETIGEEWIWDKLYPSNICSVSPEKEIFDKGETLLFNITNSSDVVLDYGLWFALEIQIGDIWYPVVQTNRGSATPGFTVQPNSSVQYEISPERLAYSVGFVYDYDEETNSYSSRRNIDKAVNLISGHYRFAIDLDPYPLTREYNCVACEFDVK